MAMRNSVALPSPPVTMMAKKKPQVKVLDAHAAVQMMSAVFKDEDEAVVATRFRVTDRHSAILFLTFATTPSIMPAPALAQPNPYFMLTTASQMRWVTQLPVLPGIRWSAGTYGAGGLLPTAAVALCQS
ncbi:hypothetical protein FRC07_006799 [Ceratobasidium sp. 392]|nr:hypothetical protein FRC07_006799 [Ceratobasidium sp. 392]